RRHQQARWRHGTDLGPQGVPASDGRGRADPADDPGRVPRHERHDRLARTSQHRRAGPRPRLPPDPKGGPPCRSPPMTKAVLEAITTQIGAEFNASFSYLSMAGWCEHHKLTGAGRWLRAQSQEEHG